MDMQFKLNSEFKPSGDQPQAIKGLMDSLRSGAKHQTLLGVTGSGKTFTIANIIAELKRPALIISHNKTLTAQLYEEMKGFFPENAVCFFVSYYDYYQPEAYVPARDLYIEKTAQINEVIDRMRHSATTSLLTREDVIIVASVSSIFGLGNPTNYMEMTFKIETGQKLNRDDLMKKLVYFNYNRNDVEKKCGLFRVRGDIVEFIPSYSEDSIRVEFFDDEIDGISIIDRVTGKTVENLNEYMIFSANHYAVSYNTREKALELIEAELIDRCTELEASGKLEEAERLKARTLNDLTFIKELGYCSGIENYSRHLDGRAAGEPPSTLMSYFPDDFLLFIDESHVTVPQIGGMYHGDRARKTNLVEHGFRLPSALDNRPLNFKEFSNKVEQVVYLSATPKDYEINLSGVNVFEQIVRPTGLVDPPVEVVKTSGQIEYLFFEIKQVLERDERVLVTTLTKKMSEDLSKYLREMEMKVEYLHSDIETLERIKLIKKLRTGELDIIVGVNLLREGLDIPEVSLVAVLDADKEGFLRSRTSLIQVSGRASRNVNGKVIFFADTMTKSMKSAISEMERRREIQVEYNRINGIVPKTIRKNIVLDEDSRKDGYGGPSVNVDLDRISFDDLLYLETEYKEKMTEAASGLEFELAAVFRDELKRVRKKLNSLKR
ncbi:excinuclease ABC subunit UvrB [bacterium]|nr:excinuclease ABC subunit UvrB [bacterium]